MSVFVAQKPKIGPNGYTYDISPSLEFGQPVYVFEDSDQPGLAPVPSLRRAREVMRDFTDDDYILWAGGDPYSLAIVIAVAMEVNGGRAQFLRWERQRDRDTNKRTGRGYYVPVRLNTRSK